MTSDFVKCDKKCPKCKSKRLILEELWINHFIQWEVIDGKIDRNDGVLEPGDAYKVIGLCRDCNHKWTFRNALQIDDVCK